MEGCPLRGVRDKGQRDRAQIIVRKVLLRATKLGTWNADMVARVVLASLTPSRVTAGIVGPCFYCGDDLADTVDHIIPVVDGGTDDQTNLVSCCGPCNRLKHDMSQKWFLRAHPFGSDLERERKWREQIHPSPPMKGLVDAHFWRDLYAPVKEEA
jgi:5-methylcytosine-specific restriction endonuclease McrA